MNHHTNIITYTWRCPFGVLAVGACRMFSGPKSAEAEIPRSRGGDGTWWKPEMMQFLFTRLVLISILGKSGRALSKAFADHLNSDRQSNPIIRMQTTAYYPRKRCRTCRIPEYSWSVCCKQFAHVCPGTPWWSMGITSSHTINSIHRPGGPVSFRWGKFMHSARPTGEVWSGNGSWLVWCGLLGFAELPRRTKLRSWKTEEYCIFIGIARVVQATIFGQLI